MNIRRIAKMAGVSSATVSRVINGSSLVKSATAERVQRVIDDLQFVPDNNATALRSGSSGTYGLLIPDITNPFFPEFMKSLESLVVEHDRELLVATIDFHQVRMVQSVRRMLTRRVNGVVLMGSEIETQPFEALVKNRIPLVTMDRQKVGPGLSDITTDYEAAMGQAVEHLKALGHRKIGFIGGFLGLVTSKLRLDGFIAAMRNHDLPVREELIRHGDYRIPGGETAMLDMLIRKNRPTAVMTANDMTAIGALRALRDHGVAVPKEISVVGLDDIELSDIVYPPLTTLHTSRTELARLVFASLEHSNKQTPIKGRQYTIQAKLVVRKSSGPVLRSLKKTN
jgi:DNA-binding LacI/PurR family transcriptional regulator